MESYPSPSVWLESVSSVCNLKTLHAVVAVEYLTCFHFTDKSKQTYFEGEGNEF
jgi:hypothetical protein